MRSAFPISPSGIDRAAARPRHVDMATIPRTVIGIARLEKISSKRLSSIHPIESIGQ
jgi:hypothetical protein